MGRRENMTARHEDRSNVGVFVCGLLTGAALGAATAILLAPKAGWKMRRDLADGVADLGQAAKDRWGDVTAAASSAVDKGREAFDQARGTVQDVADSKSADRVKGAVKDAASDVASAITSGASSAKGPVGGNR
jgi:gas vesicle protein